MLSVNQLLPSMYHLFIPLTLRCRNLQMQIFKKSEFLSFYHFHPFFILSEAYLQSLLRFMSTESVMLSDLAISSSSTTFSFSLQSFPASESFSSKSALQNRWTKYWSFSISPSNEHPGLISFRMDWFDILAVQRILMSLLQHHNSKVSILRRSGCFMVQLSHPCMTTRKTIALTMKTFVGKVMSLLFNMLSRFVVAFLPKSKCLLVSWLQSPSALILEPKKIKSVTVFIVSHLFAMK